MPLARRSATAASKWIHSNFFGLLHKKQLTAAAQTRIIHTLTKQQQGASKMNAQAKYVFVKTYPVSGATSETHPMTVAEAVDFFRYTLKQGAASSKGGKRVNVTPVTIKGLLTSLNNASSNMAANGCGPSYIAINIGK
jgi:hypothetical protein